jgi:hypothetical protein
MQTKHEWKKRRGENPIDRKNMEAGKDREA